MEINVQNTKVVCWGSGVIGSSWAAGFAMKGFPVTVYDLEEAFLEKARTRMEDSLSALESRGYLTHEAHLEALGRTSFTTSPEEALRDADFVQESAPEKLAIKQSITETIDRHAPETCVVASSTSGLKISDITAHSARPERYVGAHPFNPPHLIPLVELTRGEHTAQSAVNYALALYRAAGKEPILLNIEKPGFVANRFQHAVLREYISLITEGVCSVADADRALTYGPGLRWAAIGQGMIGELASPEGAEAFNRAFAPASETIFRDLSCMTKIPETWPKAAGDGVKEELDSLPDCIGHSHDEVAAFRDDVLLALLRLHGKL